MPTVILDVRAITFLTALIAAIAPGRSQDTLAPLMGRGVSRALAERRAGTVSDVRYALALDVTALDSAVGRVLIQFRRSGSGDEILDFRGRRLRGVVANGNVLPLGVFNGAHLRIRARALKDGENTLDLQFVSEIAPSGASVIRFHDESDGSDYLYTLLVSADANQLFPCFDQPDLRRALGLT